MRLNPEESLEWLREYDAETAPWVYAAYEQLTRQIQAEIAYERSIAEVARRYVASVPPDKLQPWKGRYITFPVKTGRNRP